jgi:hypothetical protein
VRLALYARGGGKSAARSSNGLHFKGFRETLRRAEGFLTDTTDGQIPGQLAGVELRHRQHTRVEDRIRQAKATGLRNLPSNALDAKAAWLEIILAATDLIAWTKMLGFTDQAGLARCEIAAFRYWVLHTATRITRGARQIRIRIDAT